MTKYFNYLQVSILLVITGCGAGREMSFDEFNTLGDRDMWLDSNERIVPAIYEDDYIFGSKDSISVRVRDHDEFNVVTRVNLKGEILLPLIDEPLLIEGLTIEQASETVGHFLAPYIRSDALCEIELLSSGSRFYYVMGLGLNSFSSTNTNPSNSQSSNDSQSAGSISKISMGVEPVYLHDILLSHEDETNLEEVIIVRPDFTDRLRPRFMTIDMSGISHALWNKNYRIRPNDIVVVHRNFRERVKDLIDIFSDEVEELRSSDTRIEETLRFIEARLQNDSAKKSRHSGNR